MPVPTLTPTSSRYYYAGAYHTTAGAPTPTPTGTPIFSDNFESATLGDNVSTRGLDSSSGVISSDESYSGSKSIKLHMTQGSDETFSYGFVIDFDTNLVQGDEFWFRQRVFYPVGWDFGNDGNSEMGGTSPRSKFFRLHTNTAAHANRGYNDIYLYENSPSETYWEFIYEGVQSWATQTPTTGIVRGEWRTIEYYVKLHTSTSTAVARIWENNDLVMEVTDRATLVAADDYSGRFHFCTYYNGGAPATQDMWIDDIECYTSGSPPTNLDGSGNVFIGGAV